MNTNDTNRQKAYAMIDHIFKDLLPAQGMVERSEQIKLSHRMLDTMLNGGIALCDAGTGIGKIRHGGAAQARHYLNLQHRLAERRADGIPSAAVLHPAGRRTD